MKPCVIFACLILCAGAVHGLPQETLLVSDHNLTLRVHCGGMAEFDSSQPLFSAPAPQKSDVEFSPLLNAQDIETGTQVPEASTLVLLGLGILGLRMFVRRTRT